MNTFDREAFGRRSFSEKRKASNGKNKEVVAKVKALREEMKLELESTNNNTQIGKFPAVTMVLAETTTSRRNNMKAQFICQYLGYELTIGGEVI